MAVLLIASGDPALRRGARAQLQAHACFEAATPEELRRRLLATRPALLIADAPMRQALVGCLEAAGLPVLSLRPLEMRGLQDQVAALLNSMPRLQ